MAESEGRYEYRVRWKSHWTDFDGKAKWRYRYVYVQSPEAAKRLADSKQAESEEDHCECHHDYSECGWCSGTLVPASDIRILC